MDVFETGIKVVDLLTPYLKSGKIGLFGGAGVGKTFVVLLRNVEFPRSLLRGMRSLCVFKNPPP